MGSDFGSYDALYSSSQGTSPASYASEPRSLIRINNTVIIPPISWSAVINGHGVLDTAEVRIPIQGTPDLGSIVTPGQPLPVKIYAGFPPNPAPGGFTYNNLTLRFNGLVDPVEPTFSIDDQSCTLHCISYGSVLSMNKTTTNLGQANGSMANLAGVTTTQFIAQVAALYGMTTDINVSNPATMQQVYSTQQLVGIHNLKYWDILVDCAQVDGAYLWYSSDNTLHYVDPSNIQRTLTYLGYGYLKNGVKSLTGTHPLQYSKNIKVDVRSYEPLTRSAHRSRTSGSYDQYGNLTGTTTTSATRSFTMQNFGNPGSSVVERVSSTSADGTTTVSSVSGSSVTSGGETSSGNTSISTANLNETYVYKFHGLSEAQCDERSITIWNWLSSHEFRATFAYPIDETTLPYTQITTKYQLSDVPWGSWDQQYLPLRITEQFDDGGWEATVVGINHRLPSGEV